MNLDEALRASPVGVAYRVKDDGGLVIATDRIALAGDGITFAGDAVYRSARVTEVLADDWIPEGGTDPNVHIDDD